MPYFAAVPAGVILSRAVFRHVSVSLELEAPLRVKVVCHLADCSPQVNFLSLQENCSHFRPDLQNPVLKIGSFAFLPEIGNRHLALSRNISFAILLCRWLICSYSSVIRSRSSALGTSYTKILGSSFTVFSIVNTLSFRVSIFSSFSTSSSVSAFRINVLGSVYLSFLTFMLFLA